MKKIIISLSLIICIFLQVTGCTEQKTGNIIKESQKIETIVKKTETTAKKTESDIREIAYECLVQGSKNTIIDWKGAKVEEVKYITDHTVGSPKGGVNIKDKEAYMVNFRTTNEALLGPINIYIDKNTFNIIGTDYRE